MKKSLISIGRSRGLIIDKPILELLGFETSARYVLRASRDLLVIRPVDTPPGHAVSRIIQTDADVYTNEKSLTTIGNSHGVIVDRAILKKLNIQENAPVYLSTRGGALLMHAQPTLPARYRGTDGGHHTSGDTGDANSEEPSAPDPADVPEFAKMDRPDPDLEALQSQYNALQKALHGAQTGEERYAVLQRWDVLRKDIDTWGAIVSLHFHQDTADPAKKARRDKLDRIAPKLMNMDIGLKKQCLALPDSHGLAPHIGRHCFDLWASDARTFAPEIEDDLATEAQLAAQYTELRASAEIPFRGETWNLSSIGKFISDGDRAVRHAASKARWTFFAGHHEQFDAIYDKLVHTRTRMAKTLGYDSFIGLAYDRMNRTEYGPEQVRAFRDEIRDKVVPLAVALREQQRRRLGVDTLMAWDEPVSDPAGNPEPQGDTAWQVERAREMYHEMHPDLGAFFDMMVEKSLLDLESRPSKAGGGFCTSFPRWGVPFVFANFNGTKHDTTVLTHEIGHAFQFFRSRNQPILDYHSPTLEACEIHSMSLEFLSYNWMEKFFHDGADRFRRIHLAEALEFLPYGAAVDHFQHLVYETPDATPQERNQMWQKVEKLYLPDRQYGDLPHCSEGGLWQRQLHIYQVPFYYIDYALAQSVALQFWALSTHNFDDALARYVTLCGRGGSMAFTDLVASAGLQSPFQPGSLTDILAPAREILDFG